VGVIVREPLANGRLTASRGLAERRCQCGQQVPASLALAVPFIRPIVLGFGPPEFFMLAILGMSFIIGPSGKSVTKGLLMAGFGLPLSTVGQDPGTAWLRFTFGEAYLFNGVDLVPVVVGLFAVPSLIEMMALKSNVARVSMDQVSIRDSFQGVRDTFDHWWLTVRASLIGVFTGLAPDAGRGRSTGPGSLNRRVLQPGAGRALAPRVPRWFDRAGLRE
jgi:TctA family transporter